MSRWGQFQEIADLPERAFCENKYERTLEGGGKGGSQSSSVDIPEYLEEPLKRNLARAEQLQGIGYMPYYGPEIAAFNPTQLAAMQSNIGAAEAFGLIPQGQLTAAQGMPAPTTYAGGMQGYGSGDLFDQAIAEFTARRPGQAAAYNAMFVDPITGAGGMLQDPYSGLDFLNYDYQPLGSGSRTFMGALDAMPALARGPGSEIVEIDGKKYMRTPKSMTSPLGKGGSI